MLGPLEVERDGTPVPVRSEKQRRLLVALVVAGRTTVSEDRLISSLWGDDPPPSARNSLQSHVSRLRDLLGVGTVVRRPPGYALAADAQVDALRFVEDVARARHLLGDDAGTAVRILSAALGTWRGEPYAGFVDDLAREEAVRLADRHADAQELVATARLRSGDPAGALDAAGQLVARQPLRETAALVYAEALARSGRRTDALAALRTYRRRLADDLGLDPTPALDALERDLLRGDVEDVAPRTRGDTAVPAAGDTPAATGGLAAPPSPVSPTVGRADDLARVRAALEDARLVTLVGPGGVGKSRLAAVVASGAGTVAWVDLAAADRTADVVATVADGLGVAPLAGSGLDDAVDAALARLDGVLVLDGCEHVLAGAAALAGRALRRGGRVRILATSRERLDLPGETALPVDPLAVPAADDAGTDDPAVALFLDRLAAAGGPAVAPADAAAVAAAVDGLPLGLELAAARAVSLPVSLLAERLAEHPDLLAGSRRRGTERHGTLGNVIAWSYDLLDEVDRRLFDRLGVFQGTFRLEEAERICASDDLPVEAVVPALARLVEQSMAVVLSPGRYRLLQPLRGFARRRLEEAGAATPVLARQRDAVLELAARAEAEIGTPAEHDLVPRLEAALPDLRAVAARATADGDVATVAALTAGLHGFAYVQARTELLRWGEVVADALADGRTVDEVTSGDVACAVGAAAFGCALTGREARAADLTEHAVELVTEHRGGAIVYEVLGDHLLRAADLSAAVAAYRQQLEHAEAVGRGANAAVALCGIALAHAFHDDHAPAREHAEAARARARRAGGSWPVAFAEYTMGEVLADTDPDAALAAFRRARDHAGRVRGRFVEGLCASAEVALLGRHGDPDEALRLYRTVLSLWHDQRAHGLALTVLRNLVVLLVRIGADRDALMLHAVLARDARHDSFGAEARRLDAALAAARERLGPAASDAKAAASTLPDVQAATRWALELLDRGRPGHPPGHPPAHPRAHQPQPR